MPARAFPNIRPSSRRYTPGNFPQTEFRAQNGALTILRYGNKRVDSTLSLEFRNILDSEAKKIIESYYEQYPGLKSYMTDIVETARANGYVETLMGRRRYLRNINSGNSLFFMGFRFFSWSLN